METIEIGIVATLLLFVAWLLGFGVGREDHWLGWIGLLIILALVLFFVILFIGSLLGVVEPLV